MKIAVIGGGGYLGSTIVQELKKNVGVEVVIYDNGLFSDEYLEIVEYKDVNILNGTIDLSSFDKILWCCDIDVQNFYTTEFSTEYIKANISTFQDMCKIHKKKMCWIKDCSKIEQPTYADMLEQKESIISVVNGTVYDVPQLYGPSARMRFDTLLNTMFAMAVVDGGIYLEDWMDKIPVQSVGLVARDIAREILEKDYLRTLPIVHSKIEYACIIKKVFEDKIEIVLADNRGGKDDSPTTNATGAEMQDFSIEKSFTYMRQALENGALDSVVKDRYNNSRIIANFLASDKFFKFKSEITG